MGRHLVAIAACVLAIASSVAAQSAGPPAILLLAHGGSRDWNATIQALVERLNTTGPAELALGMAARSSLQSAADRLTARGAKAIVVVPLFISSHSSVITATEYLLGLRAVAPPELAAFARMNHGTHGGAAGQATDGTTPLALKVPVAMTPALNRHPLVVEILASRAAAISAAPAREAAIIVAHGPTGDAENRLWLDDMSVLAAGVRDKIAFRSIDALTVRDDAAAPVRDAAAAELRALVQRRAAEGSRVLIVPLLLSYGGIEAGIRKRLEGLDYTMARQGLAPDDRLRQWILRVATEVTFPPR
jgi:sirohydrochlorin ferrochelatase